MFGRTFENSLISFPKYRNIHIIYKHIRCSLTIPECIQLLKRMFCGECPSQMGKILKAVRRKKDNKKGDCLSMVYACAAFLAEMFYVLFYIFKKFDFVGLWNLHMFFRNILRFFNTNLSENFDDNF